MDGRILGGAAAAGAAGVVVGAYLLGGRLLVLAVAGAGAGWAMGYVARTWSQRLRGRTGPAGRGPAFRSCQRPAEYATIDTPTYCTMKAARVNEWKTSWKPNQRGDGFGRLSP